MKGMRLASGRVRLRLAGASAAFCAAAVMDGGKARADGVRMADAPKTQQTFDYEQIRRLKPFDRWLEGEMRSNQAGETGAVEIYRGARWALDLRSQLPAALVDAGMH